MTYRGTIKNGQIAFDESVELPEGAVVTVDVIEDGANAPTVWNRLLDLAGTVSGLPVDMAQNHDHYLYGLPKNQ